VISVFDGGACALFDGRIGVDRFPPAHDAAVVLTAVKDAARRRRRWPEGGPSLTVAARAPAGAGAGRDGRMVPGRTEGCGLPTSASHVLYRVREAEALCGSRRAPSVSETSVLSIAIIRILLCSTLLSSVILCAQIPSRGRRNLHWRGRYRKTHDHAWRGEQTVNHRNS
jgi:hypothetical protein